MWNRLLWESPGSVSANFPKAWILSPSPKSPVCHSPQQAGVWVRGGQMVWMWTLGVPRRRPGDARSLSGDLRVSGCHSTRGGVGVGSGCLIGRPEGLGLTVNKRGFQSKQGYCKQPRSRRAYKTSIHVGLRDDRWSEEDYLGNYQAV